MTTINTSTFQLVHQGVGQFRLLDHFFVVLTAYLSYGVVALVILYFLLVLPLRTADITLRSRRFLQGFEVLTSFFVTSVVVWMLKILVAHPRPFVVLADAQPLVVASAFQSFPSGHTALTMAVAIAVLPFRRHLGHLLIAFSLLVGLSRLYVGVHYPLDIIAGVIIGVVIPKLVHRIFARI